MRLLQKPFKNAKKGQTIEVTFSKPTNIKFMTASNFEKYKKGNTHTYYGGWQEDSPVEFTIPKNGTWHAVIEKGTFNNPLEVDGNATLKGAAASVVGFEEPDQLDQPDDESEPIDSSEEEASEETKEEVYAESESEDDESEEEEDTKEE